MVTVCAQAPDVPAAKIAAAAMAAQSLDCMMFLPFSRRRERRIGFVNIQQSANNLKC